MRRTDFPILSTQDQSSKRGRSLVYLDSGATTQKPQSVIDRMMKFYLEENANVHRGIYALSERATENYERVREKVAEFLGLNPRSSLTEIVFTRGTTESINIVAQCLTPLFVQEGDRIAVTRVEHHSNFVPWQVAAKRAGATLEIVETNEQGLIQDENWTEILKKKPKIVSFTAVSNVTGQKMPVEAWAKRAKESGVEFVFVDAAQATAHQEIRLEDWPSVDGLGFSGHKMCGPTGVGVLWVRETWLRKMEPYQLGGDMILQVGDRETKWNELPWKFEAGTPAIAEVIGLGAAMDYLNGVGLKEIDAYESTLTKTALDRLLGIPGVHVYGSTTSKNRAPVFSISVEGVHPHDLSTFLDAQGIAVRAGHHCAQPLMRRLGVQATLRMSLAFYNDASDVDYFCDAIVEAQKYFSRGGRK